MCCTRFPASVAQDASNLNSPPSDEMGAGKENAYEKKESEDTDFLEIKARWRNFQLKVFRTVAFHLNFSRASEELLLTQPAVPDTGSDSGGEN